MGCWSIGSGAEEKLRHVRAVIMGILGGRVVPSFLFVSSRTRVVDVVEEDPAGPAARALGDGAARDKEEGGGLFDDGWWVVDCGDGGAYCGPSPVCKAPEAPPKSNGPSHGVLRLTYLLPLPEALEDAALVDALVDDRDEVPLLGRLLLRGGGEGRVDAAGLGALAPAPRVVTWWVAVVDGRSVGWVGMRADRSTTADAISTNHNYDKQRCSATVPRTVVDGAVLLVVHRQLLLGAQVDERLERQLLADQLDL